jgi:hypothetical protein
VSASGQANSGSSASPSSTAAQPELCVSVQRSQSSVSRGQAAAYVVQVSAKNGGSASNVSVAVAAQPSSLKPTFTSGCAKGDGNSTCTVGSVSEKQPATLQAQIPVASTATSVTSVTLTATASIVGSAKWTPPSAAETVTVTAASAASKSAGPSSQSPLPLGPLPILNGVSSSLIGPGNASGLFPAIIPSATPAGSPGARQQGGHRNAEPVSDTSALSPGLSGQLAGLIALALAVMLTVTRLSLFKRFRSKKQSS